MKFPKQEKKKKEITHLPVQPGVAALGVAAPGNVLSLEVCYSVPVAHS